MKSIHGGCAGGGGLRATIVAYGDYAGGGGLKAMMVVHGDRAGGGGLRVTMVAHCGYVTLCIQSLNPYCPGSESVFSSSGFY